MNATQDEILKALTIIFRKVFSDDTLSIHMDTTPADIGKWKSLTHLDMIVEVEKHFNVRLSLTDITHIKTVSDLVNCIENLWNK
jgi:acyl carrier protein